MSQLLHESRGDLLVVRPVLFGQIGSLQSNVPSYWFLKFSGTGLIFYMNMGNVYFPILHIPFPDRYTFQRLPASEKSWADSMARSVRIYADPSRITAILSFCFFCYDSQSLHAVWQPSLLFRLYAASAAMIAHLLEVPASNRL